MREPRTSRAWLAQSRRTVGRKVGEWSVYLAEHAGWLTFIDGRIVSAFLATTRGNAMARDPVPATAVLIVPVLNSEEGLAVFLDRVPSDFFRQIIVVDGGSVDGTVAVARSRGAVVVLETAGYGAALQRGIAEVPGDVGAVAFMQTDGVENPAEARTLLEPIYKNRADLVVGSNRPTERWVLGSRLAALARIWHHFRHRELGLFRAIRFDDLKRLDIRDSGFAWLLEMEARALHEGLRFLEVPAPCKAPVSKPGLVTSDWRVQTISKDLAMSEFVRAVARLFVPRSTPLPVRRES